MDSRYTPTTAPLEVVTKANSIDELNVSERWKERFRLIEKAGPFERGNYRDVATLTPAERRMIKVNILAFYSRGCTTSAKGCLAKHSCF